jgi:hypothetical protein
MMEHNMSDLSGLHGVYPTSLRWNAESGFLSISVFNPESGERELREIELGQPATFVMDLATRERGYGLIKVGLYDMRLTPVGAPPPPWPDDEEFKPALGCWLWSPSLGELRLETNGSIVRQAMMAVWDACKSSPEAAAGQQPVICFADSVPVPVKAVGKTFRGPIIKTIGWVERDKVPGWTEREPTVLPPKALMALPTAAAPAIDTQVKGPTKIGFKAKAKAKPAANDPNDNIDDILGNDPIPY